jgi:hypothetical protein
LDGILNQYLATCGDMEKSFGDMSPEQLLARPVPDKWTSMQVLCHLVDTDLVMAARIRAALIADKPKQVALSREELMGLHFWEKRGAAEEIALFIALRKHTARLIHGFSGDPSDRSLILLKLDGTEVTRTVGEILKGAAQHVPPHLAHVREKREMLGLPVNFALHGLTP